MGEPLQHHGLVLKSNPAIRDFLAVVASSADRPSFEICSTARKYMLTDAVPYKVIRDIWMQMEPSRRPQFYSLLSGVTFVLASPKPREKSKELKDRLQKLQEAADRKAYDSLVRDVALKEEDKEYFSSYKDQLGFGLHVIVTMFTGYLVGYAAFRALFGHNPVMNAAGGIFGLVSGMLLETVLFIIRSSSHEMLSTSSTRPEKAKPPSNLVDMRKTSLCPEQHENTLCGNEEFVMDQGKNRGICHGPGEFVMDCFIVLFFPFSVMFIMHIFV